MYLCNCKMVSDQQIRQAVEEGVRTMGELSARFGLGIECGKCIDSVQAFLQTCLALPPVAPGAETTPAAAETGALAGAIPASPAVPKEPAPQGAWFAIDL